jgi:hypothetical protein
VVLVYDDAERRLYERRIVELESTSAVSERDLNLTRQTDGDVS